MPEPPPGPMKLDGPTDRPVPRGENAEGKMPPTELLRALALFAEPPGPQHPRVAALVCPGTPPDASQYADAFMFQLYPFASVYLGPEGMLGGEAAGRIAGFWQAVGREPPVEPDHLSSLLGLYVALAEEEARGRAAESSLGHQARRALLDEHLAPWVFPYLEKMKALSCPFYRRWAAVLETVLEGEVREACPSTRLPVHLRAADVLPDPRIERGDAFLAGLLAPVRSGMILTRADLAGIAGRLDLGLRAGERRYALEHLLGQDPEGVLGALASEAGRQKTGHEHRASWLGASAEFLARRAGTTADLLGELRTEASESLVAAGL